MNTFKVGARIEIPVHYDAWMRGARYGVITSIRHGKFCDVAYVKLDALPHKRIKLWRIDWDYTKVL